MSGLVVDASSLVAMMAGEPAADELADLLGEHDAVISAATLVETSMVIEAREGRGGAVMLEEILRDGAVDIVEVDELLARAAVRAWRRFGKGNHPAKLNFGDCFVYALADESGLPILCLGNDFAQTDAEVLPTR